MTFAAVAWQGDAAADPGQQWLRRAEGLGVWAWAGAPGNGAVLHPRHPPVLVIGPALHQAVQGREPGREVQALQQIPSLLQGEASAMRALLVKNSDQKVMGSGTNCENSLFHDRLN